MMVYLGPHLVLVKMVRVAITVFLGPVFCFVRLPSPGLSTRESKFFSPSLLLFLGCQLLQHQSLGYIRQKENPGNSPHYHSLSPEVPSLYAFFPPFSLLMLILYIMFKIFSCLREE